MPFLHPNRRDNNGSGAKKASSHGALGQRPANTAAAKRMALQLSLPVHLC